MKQHHKNESDYNYAGITIHAASGLHEFAMDVVLNTCGPHAHALDLGCGSGAFTKRLQDHGFKTTSVDLSLDTFKLDSDRYEIDLNADFAEQLSGKKYDVIVALELIEHLENPLHFLRQLKQIADPGTPIFISFPNLYLYWSLHSFYMTGTFGNWSPYLYWNAGHQSLMTDWLFEEHLKKSGFSMEEKHYCAPVAFPMYLKDLILHKVFFKLVCLFNRRISPAARRAEAVLFVIRNQPESSEDAIPGTAVSA